MRSILYSLLLFATCYAADPRLYSDPDTKLPHLNLHERATSTDEPVVGPNSNKKPSEAEAFEGNVTRSDDDVQSSLEKRADPRTRFEVQYDAPQELLQISEPRDSLSPYNWAYYIYEKFAGQNIYIYVIDRGVAHPDYMGQGNARRDMNKRDAHGRAIIARELPVHRRRKAIQTQASIDKGEHPEVDDDPQSHGTAVAIKALGTKFGVAKKAILIPVKIAGRTDYDLQTGVNAAGRDIMGQRDRRWRKSIVVAAMGSKDPKSNSDPEAGVFAERFTNLQDMGVPVVLASGNYAQEVWHGHRRTDIDILPAIVAQRGIPVSVIGSVDYLGNMMPASQGGHLLTACTMGHRVETYNKHGRLFHPSGTSVGKPLSPSSYSGKDLPKAHTVFNDSCPYLGWTNGYCHVKARLASEHTAYDSRQHGDSSSPLDANLYDVQSEWE
ncbi:subtilisin-like protein [Penicillium alfredii]|uniref:Subtilisin-like protein n=1 Tax=Penicillium alfredii TaxID=1506179 RepID=A0A9W9ER57_9EURO|nr:subtilisin-like protein [Penicillium alfredii]KAJ5086389.1 subtilisin-like protein [Penicillium alfredii]